MAQVQTFHIDAGATFAEELTYKGDDGELFDLTGFTARLQLRESVTAETAVLDFDLDIDVATSRLIIGITAEQSSMLVLPRYSYAVELYAPNGDVTRLLQGSFKVSPEVVR